jgi:hypothetical protein
MDKAAPSREKDRRLMLLPISAKSRTENWEPRRDIRQIDNDAPNRAQLLKDNEAPKCWKSITDNAEPMRE